MGFVRSRAFPTGRVSRALSLASALLCLGVFTLPVMAQSRSRIHQAVDDMRLATLRGNVHPSARAEFDRGPAPADLPMERMLLVLSRSPEQDAALTSLLDEQQDQSSPNFHRWLTPEQFGEQFGASDADIQVITAWLQSHGFQVEAPYPGRTLIEFSGNAAQVERAFHAPIHRYVVDGVAHWANSADPRIPVALSPVVVGVASLHDFHSRPQHVARPEPVITNFQQGRRPEITFSGSVHGLGPADYATIYNITPAYTAGINGTGASIAVVGRSNINVQDIADFRSVFGLPANAPQVIVNGTDPGDLGGGEETEAVLDVTWAGAVGRNATIKFVVSKSTNASDGVTLSETYIINNNLADVMTESFGGCEAQVTSASATAISSLAQQAAAQGITYMVSSGDSGSAGCDAPTQKAATGPLSVNVLASTPYTVAVGGTQFNENGTPSKYWSSSNGTGFSSALSHIPENVWNQSCTSTSCGTSANLYATGGGVSNFFARPSWQAGVTGLPSDTKRHVPDVSLTASSNDAYAICIQRSCKATSTGQISFQLVSGTSASAPSFAGIMALVRQRAQVRQGQANYVLYRLAAAEQYSQCSGSSTTTVPATNCIFYDVTTGNNAVPGEAGFGTATASYPAGVGYDSATGLGSVNVSNLINNWSTTTFKATTTTLTISPASIAQGASATLTMRVVPTTGTGTPTGSVSVTTSTGVSIGSFPLSAGSASTSTTAFPVGTYTVTASYSGDSTFASSNSTPVSITVIAGAPKVTLSPTSLTFATQNVGTTSAAQSVKLTNSGNGTLTLSSISISGPAAADFRGTTTCSASVPAGANCTITLNFVPRAAGSRTATMSIFDNVTGSPQTVALSGTGH